MAKVGQLIDVGINTDETVQPAHVVQFYRSDDDLLKPLGDFIADGLLAGERCVIVATAEHILKLDSILSAKNVDVDVAKRTTRYITHDAAVTLAKIMSGNRISKKRFDKIIGGIIAEGLSLGNPIRIYGEMVALLWKDGNREAVLQLEESWNRIMSGKPVILYCAYPSLHFIMDKEFKAEVCDCHTSGVPALSGF